MSRGNILSPAHPAVAGGDESGAQMRRSTDRKCLDEELHRYVRTERPFHEASVVPSKKLPELPDMRLMTEYAQS